jgi:dTDP-4-amino-4,6-dideoxygalactose transaminase
MPAEKGGPRTDGSLWRLWTAEAPARTAFSNARSALAALLGDYAPKCVWLPAYACTSLADAAADHAVRFYGVDATLEPDVDGLARHLSSRDAVVVIDYFGRPPGVGWRRLAERFADVLWIEDRSQALETAAPGFGTVNLFSPRKLVGVGDGGLLVGAAPLPSARDDAAAIWAPEEARALDPDGLAPDTWYGLFRQREDIQRVSRRQASERTVAALDSIAASPIAEVRRSNWRALARGLAGYALWPIAAPAFAPMAFPIVVHDAAETAARLAANRIWAPRHWPELPSPAADFPDAHWLAAHCLSLPLDQRYGALDMARVVAAVLDCAKPAGAR